MTRLAQEAIESGNVDMAGARHLRLTWRHRMSSATSERERLMSMTYATGSVSLGTPSRISFRNSMGRLRVDAQKARVSASRAEGLKNSVAVCFDWRRQQGAYVARFGIGRLSLRLLWQWH